MDLVLRMAADTGLYVLARPGPYINGEVNAGGLPRLADPHRRGGPHR